MTDGLILPPGAGKRIPGSGLTLQRSAAGPGRDRGATRPARHHATDADAPRAAVTSSDPPGTDHSARVRHYCAPANAIRAPDIRHTVSRSPPCGGLRQETLRWTDLDLESGTITVRPAGRPRAAGWRSGGAPASGGGASGGGTVPFLKGAVGV